jgi:demethylmenaquinone methyltransferase/2-methoxy-6-polyprenyl-1,4-benzoquinol methylase
LITGDRDAYEYLNASIASYPGHEAMTGELTRAGFTSIKVRRMTGGIVALHSGIA